MNWIIIAFSKPPINSVSGGFIMGQGYLSEELIFQIHLVGRVLYGFTSTDNIFFLCFLTVHLDIIM